MSAKRDCMACEHHLIKPRQFNQSAYVACLKTTTAVTNGRWIIRRGVYKHLSAPAWCPLGALE